MNQTDFNGEREIILALAIIVATVVLGSVYFGLSRLLHEYVISFLLSIVCSFYALNSFRQFMSRE